MKLIIGSEASIEFQKSVGHIEVEIDEGKFNEEFDKWSKLLNSKVSNSADELASFVKLKKAMKK